jgi:hypothetical protein
MAGLVQARLLLHCHFTDSLPLFRPGQRSGSGKLKLKLRNLRNRK